MVHAELCLKRILQVRGMCSDGLASSHPGRGPGAHPGVIAMLCLSLWPRPPGETPWAGRCRARTPGSPPGCPHRMLLATQGQRRVAPGAGAVPPPPARSAILVPALSRGSEATTGVPSSPGRPRSDGLPAPCPGPGVCHLLRDRPTAARPPPPAEGPGLQAPAGSASEASTAPPRPPGSLSLGPHSGRRWPQGRRWQGQGWVAPPEGGFRCLHPGLRSPGHEWPRGGQRSLIRLFPQRELPCAALTPGTVPGRVQSHPPVPSPRLGTGALATEGQAGDG